MNDAAVTVSKADASVSAADTLQYEKMRHWSDAHRLPADFPELEPRKQFDLVIVSDCLYFMSQREPLASSIYARMSKPNGRCLVVHQTRATTGQGTFQMDRFTSLLAGYGLGFDVEDGPWDWDAMRDAVICSNAAEGQADLRMSRTTNEHDIGPYVLTLYWPDGAGRSAAAAAATAAAAAAADVLDPTPKEAFNDIDFWKTPMPDFDLDDALAAVGSGRGAASAATAAVNE